MGKDGFASACATGGMLPLNGSTGKTRKFSCSGFSRALSARASRTRISFRPFPKRPSISKFRARTRLTRRRQFAAAQGAQLDGYDSSIVFDVDDTAKTYLEREVGLAASQPDDGDTTSTSGTGRRDFSARCKKKNSTCASIPPAASSATRTNSRKPRRARASNAPPRRPPPNLFCATRCTPIFRSTIFARKKRIPPSVPTGATGVSPGSAADFAPRTRRTG